MALFQPTNVTPDLKGGVKNGVVLIPAGTLTPADWDISWSVNGNSKMTAYQIDFYQNTAASTLTGSTGKITLDTPFSAISTDGTEQRFTATVAWTLISGTYAGTGTLRGKFKITQWWGSGADDYVEQRSLSVFEVSHAGSVHVILDTGYGGKWTFSGLYSPPAAYLYGNVPLNWARWQIRSGNVQGEIIHDSGKVWNATDLSYSTPMLAPGNYAVVLTAEGANGAEYLDSYDLEVEGTNMATINDLLTVKCDREHDALKIYMQNSVAAVPGTQTGSVTVGENNEIVLSDMLARVNFNFAKYSSSAWSVVWHGKIDGLLSLAANRVFAVNSAAQQTQVFVSRQSNQLRFTPSGTGHPTITYAAGDEFWIIFTRGYYFGGSDDGYQWLVYSEDYNTYWNWPVTNFNPVPPREIILDGNTTVYGVQIGFGTGNSSLADGMDDTSAETVFEGPKIVYPYSMFSGFLTAAWLPLGDADGGGSLFRGEGEIYYGMPLTYVGDFLPATNPDHVPYILDYAALNNRDYRYVVTSARENAENGAMSYTGKFQPCFWNWLLIEAAQDAQNKELYEALQVFRFEGNVSSGSYTNRGARNIQPTFTPYPAVFRSTQNSRQGTLTGLIGKVTGGVYSDSNETEAALRALSTSRYQLFLRDRRGNLIKIALAGEISMSVNDSTAKQEITVSVPWVETGPTDGVSVFERGWDLPEPEV